MGHPAIAIHEDQVDSYSSRETRRSESLRAREMSYLHSEDDDVDDQSVDGFSSEDSEESEDEIDESVMEDMRKLEESFKGISQKYRLINRIGEGQSLSIPHRVCNHWVAHCRLQALSLPCTRPNAFPRWKMNWTRKTTTPTMRSTGMCHPLRGGRPVRLLPLVLQPAPEEDRSLWP